MNKKLGREIVLYDNIIIYLKYKIKRFFDKTKSIMKKRTIYEKSDRYIYDIYNIWDGLNMYFEDEKMEAVYKIGEYFINKKFVESSRNEKLNKFIGFYLGYIYANCEIRKDIKGR